MLSNQNFIFFFFNDTATTEIYTLSLHDALPISKLEGGAARLVSGDRTGDGRAGADGKAHQVRLHQVRLSERPDRSEEHTSELQSRQYIVCRLLLEKKKNQKTLNQTYIHL